MQRLAGRGWETLKAELISTLVNSSFTGALADVYLYEQQWNAAIRLAEAREWDFQLVAKVVEAVLPHRPE